MISVHYLHSTDNGFFSFFILDPGPVASHINRKLTRTNTNRKGGIYDLDKFRFSARISTYISPNETGLLQSPRLKKYNTLFLEAPEKVAAIESLHVLIRCTKLKYD